MTITTDTVPIILSELTESERDQALRDAVRVTDFVNSIDLPRFSPLATDLPASLAATPIDVQRAGEALRQAAEVHTFLRRLVVQLDRRL
ncbi:hypothetical protein [Frondihabitans australicus]|uniref:Uncharacterized protein n=1 Tax=Frondihabitans australicus TaxID=386892 RepID=A0A495IED6_9MICO|nr:hypothetical protein [Frondihabitans australicus]RKR74357.1 hypothetical protein C8E83_1468 [Frondihabitans australicus]